MILRFVHGWGGPIQVAGHFACRHDPAVPVVACVLAGVVVEGRDAAGAFVQGAGMAQNAVWAVEVARSIAFEKKPK